MSLFACTVVDVWLTLYIGSVAFLAMQFRYIRICVFTQLRTTPFT